MGLGLKNYLMIFFSKFKILFFGEKFICWVYFWLLLDYDVVYVIDDLLVMLICVVLWVIVIVIFSLYVLIKEI